MRVHLPPFQALIDAHAAEVHRFLAASIGPERGEDCLQGAFLSGLRAERRRAARGEGRMAGGEEGVGRPPPAELERRALTGALSRRAGEAGLLDVAYAETDSPIGELIVFVTPRGLLRVTYADEPIEGV